MMLEITDIAEPLPSAFLFVFEQFGVLEVLEAEIQTMTYTTIKHDKKK